MKKEEYHKLKKEEVLEKFKTSSKGLSSNEAKIRLEKNGKNELKSEKKESLFMKFLNQFKDFMVIILLIASLVSFYISYINKESYIEPIAILVVVFINAVVGLLQELKAEKSLEALQNLTKHLVKVKRDGRVLKINSEELVVGDICFFEAGDFVPADLRIIKSFNLKAEESSLTGESVPVDKNQEEINEEDLPLGDRKNMLYSSSLITYGNAEAVVVDTGMDTEVGKIATMLSNQEKVMTPLEKKLEDMGKKIGILCVLIAAVIFFIGLSQSNDIMALLMLSISLAAAAIPEGLPAVSTIILSIGVERLARKKAIAKKLPAVEALGSTTVICTDKTGTLTQNKMTVQKIFVNGEIIDAKNSTLDETTNRMMLGGVLCNNTEVSSEGSLIGDPTETALVAFAFDHGFEGGVLNTYKKVYEFPFDSERKRMTTVHDINGKYYLFTKGGVDEILNISKMSERKENILCKIEDAKNKIQKYNKHMAENALRVLAIGYKILDEKELEDLNIEDAEKDLIFLGLFGMIDPPREEVKESINECMKAGIKTIMITGDHKITAKAIAEDLKIYKDGDNVIDGTELKQMSFSKLKNEVKNTTVFARVNPEDKLKIVNALQENGEIVAMTGDGVNDAPALKTADIGCSMGKTGTEVAKEASDIVITDDNFATIVNAVKEGRKIFQNILKAVHFLLASNTGEVLTILISLIISQALIQKFGLTVDVIMPLMPLQLLWVNLVTDTLPALALSMDPADKDIMNKKPIKKNTVFTKGMVYRIIYQGIIVSAATILAYILGLRVDESEEIKLKTASTMAFFTLAFSQIFFVFSVRNDEKTIFSKESFNNKFVLLAVLISSLLMFGILAFPKTREIFNILILNKTQIFELVAILLSITGIIELFKLLGINTLKDEK